MTRRVPGGCALRAETGASPLLRCGVRRAGAAFRHRRPPRRVTPATGGKRGNLCDNIRMARFVLLTLIGSNATIAVNPEHVTHAQQFDSGRGGIGTTLKLLSGESVHVSGTLDDVLARLRASD